jgi:triosephosphate isomerase
MRTRLVVGNWKMHGSLSANEALLAAVRGAGSGTAVCVPFPYLRQALDKLGGSPVAWGAQSLSEHASGAYTGEVAGSMLRDFGCTYVLVGHSERRSLFGESDEAVAGKFAAAQAAGLVPILCVGETLAQREAGETEGVVARQVDVVLGKSGVAAMGGGRAVLAYEPVWAIGTGKTASPAQVQAVHAFLRGHIASRDATVSAGLTMLYGGSVKPSNAAELFGQIDVDGGLIGGASLVAADFLAICAASRQSA